MAKKKPKYRPTPDEMFETFGNPFFWRMKAEQLKHSGDIVEKEADRQMKYVVGTIKENKKMDIGELMPLVGFVSLALYGFSIECLLKGIAIKNEPSLISNGKLNKKLKSHNLITLAKNCGIQLTNHERIFCEQAMKAMTVDSRYPVGLEAETKGAAMEIGGNSSEVFQTLYTRLFDEADIFNKAKK